MNLSKADLLTGFMQLNKPRSEERNSVIPIRPIAMDFGLDVRYWADQSGQSLILACDGFPKQTLGLISLKLVVCHFSLAARSRSARLQSSDKA